MHQKVKTMAQPYFCQFVYESDTTGNELILAYRHFYIQEDKLSDSAFYDDVCDLIAAGGFDDEDKTDRILQKMAQYQTICARRAST